MIIGENLHYILTFDGSVVIAQIPEQHHILGLSGVVYHGLGGILQTLTFVHKSISISSTRREHFARAGDGHTALDVNRTGSGE